MTIEIITVEELHKIVNSKKIQKVRLTGHETVSGKTYDIWIVEYPDSRGEVRYYTPQT